MALIIFIIVRLVSSFRLFGLSGFHSVLTMVLFNGLTRAEFLHELFSTCTNRRLHVARDNVAIEVRNRYARRVIGTSCMGFRDLDSITASGRLTGAMWDCSAIIEGKCIVPVYMKVRPSNPTQKTAYFMVGRLTGDAIWFMRLYARYVSHFMTSPGVPSRQLLLAHFREFWEAFQLWFRTTVPCPTWAP